MFEQPRQLTFNLAFFALPQVFDFLGHILPIKILDSVHTQGLHLVLHPCEVIALVEF
jgi:hypothetical protein